MENTVYQENHQIHMKNCLSLLQRTSISKKLWYSSLKIMKTTLTVVYLKVNHLSESSALSREEYQCTCLSTVHQAVRFYDFWLESDEIEQ